jgi:hypothetical protein
MPNYRLGFLATTVCVTHHDKIPCEPRDMRVQFTVRRDGTNNGRQREPNWSTGIVGSRMVTS